MVEKASKEVLLEARDRHVNGQGNGYHRDAKLWAMGDAQGRDSSRGDASQQEQAEQ